MFVQTGDVRDANSGRTGGIVLVATPIGNIADFSPRGQEVLREADLIACEDTRRTRKLLSHFCISGKTLIAMHEHNEQNRALELINCARNGQTVAVVSDSGMPGISDPGSVVVELAHAADVMVSAIPGPSAAILAVALSGFACKSFWFLGFLPKSGSEQKRCLDQIVAATTLSVFYESPHRIRKTAETLHHLLEADRGVVVLRELTKKYEAIWRGKISEIATQSIVENAKGEYVVVVDRAAESSQKKSDEELVHALRYLIARGNTKRDAIEIVAELLGARKNAVTDLATSLD